MFKIGDLVVHPMHGAGIIDDIVKERVEGATLEYYVFKQFSGNLLLKIPIENTNAIGVRRVVSPSEAEKLLSDIPTFPIEATANWNKRYQENVLRLKSGDPYEVARVIKTLMHLGKRHSLSNVERKMLQNAKRVFISEVALTEHVEYDEMENRVDQIMMQLAAC